MCVSTSFTHWGFLMAARVLIVFLSLSPLSKFSLLLLSRAAFKNWRKLMQIIYKKLDELRPYEKNPRKNDDAIDNVAKSIEEFGFKVPIVVDKDNVIVAGHTRFEASRKLHLSEVPCIVADDLTPMQIKAFRLADNKVSEASRWDDKLLAEELEDLDIDMSDFGFEIDEDEELEIDDDEDDINERHRTDDAYNLGEFDINSCDGFYQMPIIHGSDVIPERFIGFNYAKTSKDFDMGVHFFIDDYQFERVWNDPLTNIERLSKFKCLLTPDFSLYLDMPIAMQIWNVYRSRLIGQMMERQGLKVIPTVSWSAPESYTFCFDGLPKRKVLAISTVGVKRSEESLLIYRNGVGEMVKRLTPKKIVLYGGMVDADYGESEIIEFKNEVTERMKNGRK